jgi:Icc-related predicted phosphoesterase
LSAKVGVDRPESPRPNKVWLVETVKKVVMKIAAMSDLHLEFERGRASPSIDNAIGADLVILAGDVDIGTRGFDYAAEVSDRLGAPVVYVLGNHEGYDGTPFDQLYDALREKAGETGGRVHVLENRAVRLTIKGEQVYILGATLWTDYAANGPELVAFAMRQAARGLNDHVRCRLRGGPFTPSDARDLHFSSRAWLDAEVEKIRVDDPEAQIIIVTHHAPILDANPPQYRGGALAPAFVSDMRAEIEAWQPALWVFGHTHHDIDMRIGETRLLSRQRGYVGFEASALDFQPAIVEI